MEFDFELLFNNKWYYKAGLIKYEKWIDSKKGYQFGDNNTIDKKKIINFTKRKISWDIL